MRVEQLIVDLVLTCILGILTWAAASAFAGSGALSFEIALLCISIVTAGVAFAGVVRLAPKIVAWFALGISIAAGTVLLLSHFNAIPLCGDGVCGVGECNVCTKDCPISACTNGVCDPPKERCDNTKDCACLVGTTCLPGRNVSDPRGCGIVTCGDNHCDRGETQLECCGDCGCQSGFVCAQGKCFFQPPDVGFSIRALTNNISVTSLVANPNLYDRNGAARPLAGLFIHSDGYMRNVSVQFALDGLLNDTVDGGFLKPGDEVPVLWYPRVQPSILTIAQDKNMTITITITYIDTQGDLHIIVRNVPILVRGHGTLDAFGHVVAFVTPISIGARTPERMWDLLGERINITPQTETVKFPAQTLRDGSGSPRDVAVLYAAACDEAGISSAIVEGPVRIIDVPKQWLVSVRVPRGEVMLDPAKLGMKFEDAIVTYPGYAYYDVRETRLTKNLTMITYNMTTQYVLGPT